MLKDALYAPSIAYTLISLGRCDDAGYQAIIVDQKCILLSKARKPLLQAPKIGGLYRLDLQSMGEKVHQCLSAIEVHRTLGHISQKLFKYLLEHNMILGIEKQSFGDKITCDACIQSKIMRKPLPKEPRERSKRLGDRVYSDVWGPARHTTINKKSYNISFIDDYSRESVIYLMGKKDEVFAKYKLYEAMMLRKRDVHIKSLVSDQGGEYTSKEFEDHLAQQGTNHRMTIHDTPEQNRVAK
jgi:Integrase core domain/GAG-pre-integrase domain